MMIAPHRGIGSQLNTSSTISAHATLMMLIAHVSFVEAKIAGSRAIVQWHYFPRQKKTPD